MWRPTPRNHICPLLRPAIAAVTFLVLTGGAGAERLVVVPEAGAPDAGRGADAAAAGHRWEISGGGDVGPRATSVYATGIWSPFADVRADGWRLRYALGVGEYRYDGARWNGTARVAAAFSGTVTSADAMLGYQATLRALTVKAYLGWASITHEIGPLDPDNAVQGGRSGVKAALETWLAIGDAAFLQADAAWAQAFDTRTARLRAGLRLAPAWSTGIEVGYGSNAGYDAGRLGGFARFEWARGEVSVSGGVGADRTGETGGYGTIGVLWRF